MSSLAVDMQRVFGLPPGFWACHIALHSGLWMLDPLALQRGLEMVTHERVADGE